MALCLCVSKRRNGECLDQIMKIGYACIEIMWYKTEGQIWVKWQKLHRVACVVENYASEG